MLKFCVDQWDKNKERLREDIETHMDYYNNASYKDLVAKVVDLIFNEEDNFIYDNLDSSKITEIDNGDYQGTLLYLIPYETYQPSEYEYLMTHVSYGSCSVCDTLQSIQMWGYYEDEIEEKDKEKFVNEIMNLCLHLVQNTIKPYNSGWRYDERFDIVSE